MKKKYLKEDLEYAEKMLKETRQANYDLAVELDTLKAEKRNREISNKIANAIGSGSIFTTSANITSAYGEYANLEIILSGDDQSLYNLGMLFRDGI